MSNRSARIARATSTAPAPASAFDDSAYSNGSSASDQARHWLARKCPSGRVASQNSETEGQASSDSACSIRLLTGAKPVSQAANTSG